MKRAAAAGKPAKSGDPSGFLGTPAARALRDGILERLASCASTPAGRERLRGLEPCADPAEARRRIAFAMACRAQAEASDPQRIRPLLKRIQRIQPVAPRLVADRVVVADDEAQERLHALGASGWTSLCGPEAFRSGAGPGPGPEEGICILAVGQLPRAVQAALDEAGAVPLPDGAGLAEVAPEAILAQARAARPALEACRALAAAFGRPTGAGEALAALDAAPPAAAVPAGALAAHAAAVRAEAEALLKERLGGISLRGDELVSAWGGRLPAAVQREVDAALAEGQRRFTQRTGVAGAILLPGPPLAVDEEEVARLEQERLARGAADHYHAMARAAARLEPLLPKLDAELAAWLAFDADYALGCFALELDLLPPRIGPALAFDSSLHLALVGKPGAQPVAYRLGPEAGGGGASVALLTGANSGGKTTLLEHLGQLAILVRLGLPVPGRGVEVPWLDEVHLVTARRALDAGAFESFLRSFLPLARPGARRLVLADEVEAVTELEAAGRILAFFLERMCASGSLAVVVTHLAPQVLQHCGDARAAIRVDGIEATGLDGRHRLVVDRTPRMGHLARSTPELIVQRLAATAKGADKALYEELAAALAQAAAQAPGPATAPAAAGRPGAGGPAAAGLALLGAARPVPARA